MWRDGLVCMSAWWCVGWAGKWGAVDGRCRGATAGGGRGKVSISQSGRSLVVHRASGMAATREWGLTAFLPSSHPTDAAHLPTPTTPTPTQALAAPRFIEQQAIPPSFLYSRLADEVRELKFDLTKRIDGTDAAINELRAELKADMKELSSELRADQKELRAELKADQKELRADLKADQKELRAELKAEFKGINGRLDNFTKIESDIGSFKVLAGLALAAVAGLGGLLVQNFDKIAEVIVKVYGK